MEPDPLAPLDGLLRARLPGNRKIDRLLRTKAAEGKLLLLIDGWDESPSGSRGQATAWLQAVLDDYAEIKVIMAGPQEDYGPLMELDFVVTGLLPWRVGQVERLGRSWAEALNLDTHQPTHSFWQPGQSILETSLRLRLALNGHNDDTSQPTGRQVDLMEMALRQLLPLETNLDEVSWLAPAARELWQELAYCQMVEGVASQSQSEILTLIDTIVAEYDAEGDRRAARKLFDSLRACGLFVFYSNEQVGFLSPVWRDFLAACHLAQQRHGQEVIGRAADRHWAGVLRFYVARCGAADLARSLLENENGAKEELFFQLASWLSEATDEGEWRRQTMVGLGRLIVDANAPTAIRQRATLALALTGEDGVVAFLRQLLQQPDPNMRQVALACLARVAPEIAVGLLEQMSGDSEASIRYTAVHALAWMDEPAAEQPILEALIEPDEAMYQAAAEGIALNSTEDSFEILREASTEMALTIRRAAVHGLTLVDEPWAAELLGKMAKEDDQWVIQTSAAAALENSGLWSDAAAWQAPQPGDQGWLISWAIAQGRAVPVGPAAMSVLLDALRDRDAAVQMAATITLGQMAARVSTKRLRALMTDSPNALREAAYVALCRIKRAWGDQMYSG